MILAVRSQSWIGTKLARVFDLPLLTQPEAIPVTEEAKVVAISEVIQPRTRRRK